MVYVDFWATWCVPCLGQFQYAAEANDLAAENGVKIVYVSIDKKGSEDAWLRTIKHQKLRGLHILVSDELRRELNEVYRVNAIPRYMIIDKDGDVKSEKAPRPSQLGDLREELHKHTDLKSTDVKN